MIILYQKYVHLTEYLTYNHILKLERMKLLLLVL